MLPFVRMFEYGNVKPSTDIVDVITSYGNIFVIYNDGIVFGSGDNSAGELGQNNTNSYRTKWVQMSTPNIKKITCSRNTTIILTEQNEVYICGAKNVLGFGNNVNALVPENITSLFSTFDLSNDVVMCGSSGIFVHRANGDLYAIGQGTNASASLYGNMGLGSTISTSFKLLASGVKKLVTSISSSSECSFYISNSGELWSTGRNGSGACGVGFAGEQPVFKKVTTVFDSPITNIFCANSTAIVCTENGTLYGCGRRYIGECGDGTTASTPTNYTTFTKNNVFTLPNSVQYTNAFYNNDAIYLSSTNNKMYATGLDYYGQFNIGDPAYAQYFVFKESDIFDSTKLRCGGYYNYIWKDNKVYACGTSSWIPGATGWVSTFIEVPIQPRII